MIVGSICLSHSPLLDRARAAPAVEADYHEAVARCAAMAAELQPDLTIIFHPDHMNGFAYGDIPNICIAEQAHSLGDFGTAPGELDVPSRLVDSLANYLVETDISFTLKSRMLVDHGAVQPLELLGYSGPVIPIFVNCAVPPLPSFDEARRLGDAVGRWAGQVRNKVLLIGSGGLSHDPPAQTRPTGTSPGQISERILDHAARTARQRRVHEAARAFAAGEASQTRPLAPDWDIEFMDGLAAGDIELGRDWHDDHITKAAGKGAHEVRCWIAAMAALSASGSYSVRHRHYAPVPEWLTGMGLMLATPDQNERLEI